MNWYCKKEENFAGKLKASEQVLIQEWYAQELAKSENMFSTMLPKWEGVHISEDKSHIIYEFPLTNPEKIFHARRLLKEGEELKRIRK